MKDPASHWQVEIVLDGDAERCPVRRDDSLPAPVPSKVNVRVTLGTPGPRERPA